MPSITPWQRRANKRYYAKHKDKERARSDRYYQQNREQLNFRAKARMNARYLAQREADAGRRKPDHCEVCGDKANVHFDHCHQRDVFRGWLCNNCNCALGFVKDDPNRLRMLIAYLERTKDLIAPQLELPV